MKRIEKFLLVAGFKPKYPTTPNRIWFESSCGDGWITISYYGKVYKAEYTVFFTPSIAKRMEYSSTRSADILAWIQAQ